MASHAEPHPDSSPSGAAESPEQVSPSTGPGRESVEDIPEGDPGTGGEKRSLDGRFDTELP